MNRIGLGQRIRAASNASEVERLLKEAERYKFASASTRRRWERLAERRLKAPEKKEERKEVKE